MGMLREKARKGEGGRERKRKRGGKGKGNGMVSVSIVFRILDRYSIDLDGFWMHFKSILNQFSCRECFCDVRGTSLGLVPETCEGD